MRPDVAQPVWFAGPKRRVKGAVPAHGLTGMPAVLPALSDHQYQLPELVGRMYDSVIMNLEYALCVCVHHHRFGVGGGADGCCASSFGYSFAILWCLFS